MRRETPDERRTTVDIFEDAGKSSVPFMTKKQYSSASLGDSYEAIFLLVLLSTPRKNARMKSFSCTHHHLLPPNAHDSRNLFFSDLLLYAVTMIDTHKILSSVVVVVVVVVDCNSIVHRREEEHQLTYLLNSLL